MDNNLIFDIGFHLGEDTRYYLHRGYRVIAVDAAPELIRKGRETFKEEIAAGRLLLAENMIAAHNAAKAAFYISPNSQWNSAHREIAERHGTQSEKIVIPTVTLRRLMEIYDVPYYCKIDIEGNDIEALESLRGQKELPRYISVETECLADNSDATESTFDTLNALHALGYRRFKLVDQQTFTVLGKDDFYGNKDIDPWHTNREYAAKLLNLTDSQALFSEFFSGSGPFGKDLAGEWYDFENARRLISFHSRQQRRLGYDVWSFWCDWHATY